MDHLVTALIVIAALIAIGVMTVRRRSPLAWTMLATSACLYVLALVVHLAA